MRIITISLLLSAVLFAVPIAAEETNNNNSLGTEDVTTKTGDGFGSALQAGGEEVSKSTPDLKKTADGFGGLLQGIGETVAEQSPDFKQVGDNVGDALEGAGKELTGSASSDTKE